MVRRWIRSSRRRSAPPSLAQIERLREEHRDLDAAIEALSDAGQAADRLQLQRLKKRKLLLRDKLVMLEDQLTPDIIA